MALAGEEQSRAEVGSGQRSITPCSFRQSGQLTGEQGRAMRALHETFARNLTDSLGASLRVQFEVQLAAIDQITYQEFLQRVPDITYMMSFQAPQMNASGAVQIENALVFPMVDILLGGSGKCESMTREVSEIEEQIMEAAARIICHELSLAWTPLGEGLELEGRQPTAQMQRFLDPLEKIVCLKFDVKLADAQGVLNLVLPITISNTLLRKLCLDSSASRTRTSHADSRLVERMLECSFEIMLGMPAIELPIQALLGLEEGALCNLGVPLRNGSALLIGGREAFEATPVRHGRQRAAQVGEPVIAPAERQRS